MNRYLLLLIMLAKFSATVSWAQNDTIRIPDQKLNTHLLRSGMNQYLIITQDTSKKKSLFFWYWLRDIKEAEHNGKPVFVITQHWFGSDTTNYRSVYSINRSADFGPVYHSEITRDKISAYNWNDKGIRGADSVVLNIKKGYTLDFKSPNLNWNLDIETFEMLPLGPNKTFAINFYDAGLDAPQYVIYKVTGSETIDYGGRKVDCWILYTEGNYRNNRYNETYWISKRDQEFLREEDFYGNGMYRTKIKVPVNIAITDKFK
ncbi:MAG: hypothetical protein ABI168_08965 [Ginsengibacter sp.]